MKQNPTEGSARVGAPTQRAMAKSLSKARHQIADGLRTDSATVFESWRRDGGDVLMLARQLTCTTKASIQSLFEFLKPPPQTVHLVLAQSSGCTAAQQLLPPGKLRCYDEARVLPIAARTVAQRYEEMPGSPRLPATHRMARRRLRDPTRLGWYFQQFVKLGFPLFNVISTDFLVWDSDAVLIAPFEPVGKDGQLRLVTGGYSNMPQVTPASRVPACPLRPGALRRVRVRLRAQYEESFSTLLNESLQYAPDRTSLVTHHMMVRACRTLTPNPKPNRASRPTTCWCTHSGALCAPASSSCRCTRRGWCSSSRG